MNVSCKHVAAVMLCLVMCWSEPLVAQQKAPPPPADELTPVTWVYDIQGLLKSVSDYPYRESGIGSGGGLSRGLPGGFGMEGMEMMDMGMGGFGGPPSPPAAKPKESRAEQIMLLLRETIDPESWRDNGGAIGALRMIGNSLVVTQTSANQRQVQHLLGQLREQAQRPVRVRAWWIWIDEEAEQLIQRKPGEGASNRSAAVFPEVNLTEMRGFTGAIRYKGEIVCFNGQTVHIAAGRGRSVVTGVNPVVGASSVGYDPQIEYVRSGAMLQVTPTIDDSGEVVLDLRCSVTELDRDTESPLIDVAKLTPTTQGTVTGGGITQVDRLGAITQSFSTTVRLPVGRPLLVGGMTLSSGDDLEKQLYLVIEVSTGD